MYKKILVPLDGSALAADILPHVQEMERCTHAQIVLVCVTPGPDHLRADADPMATHWTDLGPRTMNTVNWNLTSDPVQRSEWIEHAVESAQTYLDDHSGRQPSTDDS